MTASAGVQGGCNGATRSADRAVGYADHGATVSAPLMPFTPFLPPSAAVRMQVARVAHISASFRSEKCCNFAAETFEIFESFKSAKLLLIYGRIFLAERVCFRMMAAAMTRFRKHIVQKNQHKNTGSKFLFSFFAPFPPLPLSGHFWAAPAPLWPPCPFMAILCPFLST